MFKKVIEKIFLVNKKNQSELSNKIRGLRNAGDFNQAGLLIKKIGFVPNQELLSEVVSVCIKTKEYDFADRMIDNCLKSDPKRPDALRKKADISHRAGRHKDSIVWAEKYYNVENNISNLAFYASFIKKNRSSDEAISVLGEIDEEKISNEDWVSEYLESIVKSSNIEKARHAISKISLNDLKRKNTAIMFLSASSLLGPISRESFFKVVDKNKKLKDYSRQEMSLMISMDAQGIMSKDSKYLQLSDCLHGCRSIVQYWDNPETLTDDVRDSLDNWSRVKGFNHVLYNREQARAFINTHFPINFLKAFDLSLHPAQEADLFRLAYLYLNGGVYVDIDFLPKETFSNLMLDSEKCVNFYYRSNLPPHQREILNSFIAARRRSVFLWSALESACETILSGKRRGIWRDSGPGLLGENFLTSKFSSEVGLITHDDMFKFSLSHKGKGMWDYKTVENSWQRADKF
ncbi:glycosyltransferase [uncultured Kushneria sp.]|uniref:glycosyltransferase n=1 Tax=uncultured Kushneria sp. TaxID=905033 RepID=UPI002615D1B7|nr:glycosyltransferase [uncultured Kushneria sp.]